jgi:hypothetical protein
MSIDPFAPEPTSQPPPSLPLLDSSQANSPDHQPPPDVILSFRLVACCGLTAFTILIGALVGRALEDLRALWMIEAIASYMAGAFFSIGMLAVIWPALGQAPFQHRAAFAFLLLLGIYILFFIAMGILAGGEGPPPEMFLGIAVGILGGWAIPTFPLWCLRKAFGARMGLANPFAVSQEKQFSIGYLLAATGTIAVVLGVLRAALIQLKIDFVRDFRELLFTSFFIVAAFLICFTFYIAAMIPRYVALGVFVALSLTCLISHWELTVVALIAGSGPGIRSYFFWILNGSTALWTLMFAYIIRIHGYRLQIGK